MACWPANTIGAFMIALIIFDFIRGEPDDVPYHLILLAVFVLVFWGLCSLVGEAISGAILIVPLLTLTVGLATLWFTRESLRKQGCCINCKNPSLKKVLVRKETGEVVKELPSDTSSVASALAEEPKGTATLFGGSLESSKTCDPNLKATIVL